jgi:tRNA dimethylallyltransferase
MKKLLVICGPTATGKTGLALFLAKKFKGELISADSRQVYKGMDIGTGKDVPRGFEFRISDLGFKDVEIGFYTDGNIRLWGYDLIKPTEEFSVGQYLKVVRKIIKDIYKRGKLPILVGGTGLYVKGVVDGIPTASIPKNLRLRKTLEKKSVSELYEMLAQIDAIRAGAMNVSDRKNPRRLIRAIEIASTKSKVKSQKSKMDADTLFIGLKAPIRVLSKRIKERVEERIEEGIEKEIKDLLKSGVTWKMQAMNSLGYKQWREFFEGNKTQKQITKEWERQEKKYAKRQITWFKKDHRINWFDISKDGWQKKVEKLVKKWYKS